MTDEKKIEKMVQKWCHHHEWVEVAESITICAFCNSPLLEKREIKKFPEKDKGLIQHSFFQKQLKGDKIF